MREGEGERGREREGEREGERGRGREREKERERERERFFTSDGAVCDRSGGKGGEGDLSSGGLGALNIGNCAHIIAHRYTNNSYSR